MRPADFCRFSLKGWRRVCVPAIFFFIGAVWLGLTGWEGYRTVRAEKRQPCFLTATASIPLSGVDAVAELEGVESVSLVYPVSAALEVQNFREECVLTGVDASFVEGELISGSLYPQKSGMPYIVLNEAALRALEDRNDAPVFDIDGVDWLNAAVRLTLGENDPVTAKICGVVRDAPAEEAAVPRWYISPDAARALLRQSGIAPETAQLWLEIENSGAQEAVETRLMSLGIAAENVDTEAVSRWEAELLKARYCGIAALVALLASAVLLRDRIRLDACLECEEYDRLQEKGLCSGDVSKAANRVRLAVFLLGGILCAVLLYHTAPVLLAVLAP